MYETSIKKHFNVDQLENMSKEFFKVKYPKYNKLLIHNDNKKFTFKCNSVNGNLNVQYGGYTGSSGITGSSGPSGTTGTTGTTGTIGSISKGITYNPQYISQPYKKSQVITNVYNIPQIIPQNIIKTYKINGNSKLQFILNLAAKKYNQLANYILDKSYKKKLDKNLIEIKDLKKAAESNNKYAQYALGLYYVKKKNYRKANYYFKKSAKLKYKYAEYNLAISYLKGNGVIKDYEKAIKLLKDASNQGHFESKYLLALIYLLGSRTLKNRLKAHNLFKNLSKYDRDAYQFLLLLNELPYNNIF